MNNTPHRFSLECKKKESLIKIAHCAYMVSMLEIVNHAVTLLSKVITVAMLALNNTSRITKFMVTK